MTVWNEARSLIVGEHGCYFCQPHLYPPMPPAHALCSRCALLITIDGNDPMNEAMNVCPRCEEDLRGTTE